MYLIEFERCWKGREKQTAVRIFDIGNENAEVPIAETVFLGEPPGLTLLAGQPFTALRLPKAGEALPQKKRDGG